MNSRSLKAVILLGVLAFIQRGDISGAGQPADGAVQEPIVSVEPSPIILVIPGFLEKPKIAFDLSGRFTLDTTGDAEFQRLLSRIGLNGYMVFAEAEIEARGETDLRRPEDWTGDGSLALKHGRVQRDGGLVLNAVNGEVVFSRVKIADGGPEWNEIIRGLSADLRLRAADGGYKRLNFENLKLDLVCNRGIIERIDLDLGMGDARIGGNGSADPRNPARIEFLAVPDVTGLPLEKVAPALGVNLPVTGPLTLSGRLRGRTGGPDALPGTLDGELDWSVGPGVLKNVGILGNLIARIFSVSSINAIFSGRLPRVLAARGLKFQTMQARTVFHEGMLDLKEFYFMSDAMTIKGEGTVDLIHKTLDIEGFMIPLATIDRKLRYVPIAGRKIANLTRLRIDVEGTWDNPTIRANPMRRIGRGLLNIIKKPKRLFRGSEKDN